MKPSFYIRCIFLLMGICPLSVFGQDLYLRNYKVENGLPSNTVYSVMQDREGLMWFGTDQGISRYNGYEFESIGQSGPLDGDEVFHLFQDNNGDLWPITLSGNIFRISGNQIIPLPGDQKVTPPQGMLRSMAQTPEGVYYIVIKDFLMRMESGVVTKVKPMLGLDNIWYSNATLLGLVGSTLLNMESSDTLLKLGINDGLPTRHCYKYGLSAIFEGKKCYIITPESIVDSLVINDDFEEIISGYFIDEQTLWLGTRNGITTYDLKTRTISGHFLPGENVSTITKDFEGNLWFSTLGKGVFIWPASKIMRVSNDKKNGAGKVYSTFLDPQNQLWVGYENGQYAAIDNDGKSTFFTLEGDRKERVTSFRTLGNQQYVISKVRTINHQTGKTIKYYLNDFMPYGNHVFLMTSLVTFPEIQQFTKLFTQDNISNLESQHILNERKVVYSKGTIGYVDPMNKAWIGTDHGLYLMKNENARAIPVSHDELNTYISAIAFIPSPPLLAVATKTNGLVLIDTQSLEIKHRFNDGYGLTSTNCHTVHVDSDGIAWASFANRLYRINYNQNHFEIENYSAKIGINQEAIRSINSRDGNLYFGTDNGLLYFKISQQKQPSNHIPLTIHSISVNGVPAPAKDSIELSYKNNRCIIELLGISFLQDKAVSYQYRLSGIDTVWVSNKSRNIEFKSLPIGNYTFEARAVNGIGANSNRVKLHISISAPFYFSNWFFVLLSISLLLLVYVVFRIRLRLADKKHKVEKDHMLAIQEKQETEKKLAILQEKALRSQMNPHFVFNALNTIKGFYAEKKNEAANTYIIKFSKLLRTILEVQGAEISLEKEMDALILYLDLLQIRYENGFDYEIITSDSVDKSAIRLPSMLLQPFVENAVIHGLVPKSTRGKLTVGITIDENNLVVVIEDNGVGRNSEQAKANQSGHKSAAIDITRERLFLYGKLNKTIGKLIIDDLIEGEKPLGTRVTLTIPIDYDW